MGKISVKEKKDIIEAINLSLEKIRPYLQADGGDVSFVGLTESMDVKVRLMGACGHCPFSPQTLKAGVEQTLLNDIPQLNSVIAV